MGVTNCQHARHRTINLYPENLMKKACILLFVLGLSVSHAEAAALAKGTRELRLTGGIDFDSLAGTDFQLNLGYGQFIADYLEVGGLLSIGDNDFITTIGVGVFVEYNFDTGTQLIPFVGTQLRYLYTDVELGEKDESNSALALGGYAGVKLFITESLSINTRFLLELATDDVYLEKNKTDDINYLIDFGLGYYF